MVLVFDTRANFAVAWVEIGTASRNMQNDEQMCSSTFRVPSIQAAEHESSTPVYDVSPTTLKP